MEVLEGKNCFCRCFFEKDGEREGHNCSICHWTKVFFFVFFWLLWGSEIALPLSYYYPLTLSADLFYCSANRGDQFDLAIDSENRNTNDFIILVRLCFIEMFINAFLEFKTVR